MSTISSSGSRSSSVISTRVQCSHPSCHPPYHTPPPPPPPPPSQPSPSHYHTSSSSRRSSSRSTVAAAPPSPQQPPPSTISTIHHPKAPRTPAHLWTLTPTLSSTHAPLLPAFQTTLSLQQHSHTLVPMHGPAISLCLYLKERRRRRRRQKERRFSGPAQCDQTTVNVGTIK